jgi:non-specific serine/threonine protein kinase
VEVKVGGAAPSGLGADALLDFSVAVAADGEPLSEREWREALASAADGLVRVKGRWVEVDADKLREVLAHWKSVERGIGREGLSFLEGMRLLAGLHEGSLASGDEASGIAVSAEWASLKPGEWLRGVLAELRSPQAIDDLGGEDGLRAVLRPYQAQGVQWLRLLNGLGLGGCLADDMGLGKTLQVLALLVLIQRQRQPAGRSRSGTRAPSLLVLPASLIGNWKSECARFAPQLRLCILHPSEQEAPLTSSSAPPDLDEADLAVTTYGMAARLEWLRGREWNLVILDEAQAIKNPDARQTRAVKALRARHRLVLTGTPIENHLGDLWSLFDFLQPGLLGSSREFARLAGARSQSAAEGYAKVRALVRPYILRRLKSDKQIIHGLCLPPQA